MSRILILNLDQGLDYLSAIGEVPNTRYTSIIGFEYGISLRGVLFNILHSIKKYNVKPQV